MSWVFNSTMGLLLAVSGLLLLLKRPLSVAWWAQGSTVAEINN